MNANGVQHRDLSWNEMNWKEKTVLVVKVALLAIAAVAAFYWSPLFFIASFTLGAAAFEIVGQALDRIFNLVKAYPITSGIILPLALFFAIPASPLVLCCLTGAYIGYKLSYHVNMPNPALAAVIVPADAVPVAVPAAVPVPPPVGNGDEIVEMPA